MTEQYRTHPHRHPREKQAGVLDVERQSPTSDGAHSGHKRTTLIRIGQVKNWMAPILDPQKKFQRRWKIMFVVSCVIALSVDPLFLYLPVINEDRKCLSLDETLITTVAISLRLVTDLVYVLNIIFQFLCPYIDEVSGELVRTDARRLRNGCFLSYVTVDILAILPIPQVVIPVLLSEIRRSMSLNKRKLLNAVVLFHYIPRASRIRMSWRELKKTKTVFRTIPVKAACNLFLYIVSSHVLGALWYFFSIQREMTCWHLACEKYIRCNPSSFYCDHSFRNYTDQLNKYCPIETPDQAKLFDFGIFLEALQSGTVSSPDFPLRFLHSFWWGQRNLSSFGQNLQTSIDFWENCFAVFISTVGLILFLYFVGNLQMYMQWKKNIQLGNSVRYESRKPEIEEKVIVKKRKTDLWRFSNQLPSNMRRQILHHIKQILEEEKLIDAENPLCHLPIDLRKKIKRHLCLPILKKVPMLEQNSELLQLICNSLEPVYYNKHSCISREGEPVDAVLFIMQGIVWKSTTNECEEETAQFIGKGDFCGEELLDWGLRVSSPPSLSDLPISTVTVETRTKVYAFALMADDLRTIISRRHEAASTLQAAWRGTIMKRRMFQLQVG